MRSMAMVAACVTIIGSTDGGTMAWLINQSTPVTNVFTSSYVEVTVAESDADDGDEAPATNSYTMLPGATITKDPVVTFASGRRIHGSL